MMDFESRARLLELVRAGDQVALGDLLDELRPYVRMIVRSVHRGPRARLKDDSDLIQEAMLQASQSVKTFRGVTIAEWLAWLRTITVRATYRTLNCEDVPIDATVNAQAAELIPGLQIDPSETVIRQENAARMALALSKLPDDMQQVLLGRLIDGLDHADLANQLGRNVGATRMLYLRALRKLRDVWVTEFSSGGGCSN